jgi:hypothetical protein
MYRNDTTKNNLQRTGKTDATPTVTVSGSGTTGAEPS